MKFKSDIEVQAGLKDSSGSIGTSGQVLSSTGSNVSWINQSTVASDVQNQVKAGVAINKGQAVYVTSADGTNIIVGLASNASEATSSKTLGLLDATVAINGFANVVQIGRLSGLNTLGATAGDPVWLGTGGNLIYGLINKPYAPAHLVFIGIVTRVNVNNGEIFVNVQNGFELKEIHDVDIITNVPINGDVLGYDGTLWVNKTIAEWLGYTPANASGTVNYVSKFTGTTTLGNSQIFDNGTNVGIGTTTPGYRLQVEASNFAVFSAKSTGASTGNRSLFINDLDKGIELLTYGSTYASGSLFGVGAGGSSLSSNTTSAFAVGTTTATPLYLGTNGTEKMRVTSVGDIGIGTTSPISKLQTSGIVSVGSGASANSIGVMQLITGGASPISNKITYGTDGTGWKFAIGKNQAGTVTDQFVIQDNGNVGIGTTSPSTKLDVTDTSAGNIVNNITVQNASNTAGTEAGVFFAPTIATGNIRGARITGIQEDGNNTIGLKFYTGSGAPPTEKMRITSGGNVGIGTTNPSALLDVAGDALINGVTVGRGPGNDDTNTVVGNSAFSANISAQNNTIIGKWAGIGKQYGNGNIIIGANNYNSPDGAIVDYSNTISISRGSNIVAGGPPHIWAPADVSTSSTVDVITVNYTAYRAMFVEYVIEDESGNIRGGYIKGIWNNDASIIKMTEETTSSIGVTTNYVFDIVDNGSYSAALQLTSTSGDPVYCSVTSRLLTRPY